jgi:hypothetical protein
MPETQIQPIHFRRNDGENSTDGQLAVTLFNDKDRMTRALKRLGLFWLLSVGSLPIIFAHWVLVPGFFIAGPVAAVMVYKVTEAKDHAKGVCPSCGESVEIKLEPKDSLPKWTYCPSCNNPLQITPK